ncbi:hypothetical protein BW727_101114 [Jeotgalibaca dankookensis]|uniref:AI-2 transport protein TqsA n=1 Tax=Jeotgalibaca dankookensis TaxID=708126 RepID=A0A1S6IPK2_9LACT|nr:AI-2E family transporter [Jeotgalibaca dankookensis]AQS53482.1 hypothetical protein BW727_101114 [Jeotgalibaca dankookensis]
MKKVRNYPKKLSWFEQWILNNKFVTSLIIVLLILLIILVFSKVSYLLQPIASFFSILGFPLVLSGILYYLMNPFVNWATRRGLSRSMAIVFAFLIFIVLLIWGFAILIPVIQEQVSGFIEEFPEYWVTINQMLSNLLEYNWFRNIQKQLLEINTEVLNYITNWANGALSNTGGWLSSVVGVVTNVFVGLITMPIILYYLLKEGHKLPKAILQFLPNRQRESFGHLLAEINSQVSQYVQGQVIVATCVGIMFVIGYSIIGLNYGISLGIIAGFLNIIPYLGSFIAILPALIIGLVDSPWMLIQVIIVFSIEQFLEGRFISPQVLGSNLSIHPVTIMIVLLTSGKLFGLVGFVLGIPGYAVLKVIFTHGFEWYKSESGLYNEEVEETPVIETEADE